MERSEVLAKLKDIMSNGDGFCDKGADKATEDSELKADLNLNSVDMLYLVISIEEAFDICFDDVSFNDFKKLGDVIDFILSKLS